MGIFLVYGSGFARIIYVAGTVCGEVSRSRAGAEDEQKTELEQALVAELGTQLVTELEQALATEARDRIDGAGDIVGDRVGDGALEMEPGAVAELAVLLLLKTVNGVLMCNASCISPPHLLELNGYQFSLIFNYVTDDVDLLKLQTCLIISGSPIRQKVRYITDDDLAAIMPNSSDRAPVADKAEADAWFPSLYSLTQYTSTKTDFDSANYPNAYTGGKWKILLIATQERYLKMADGKFFSTGNHPVEMLLPLLHLDAAGFEIDIATISGDPVKLEMWAFPQEDEAVKGIYEKYKEKIRSPLNLHDVWGRGFTKDTPYIGTFIPGGHGAMNDIPFSETVGKILRWGDENQRFLITLCHGPAGMLAADVGKPKGSKFIYDGYEIVVFPDSLDTNANVDIGYIPSKMPWYVGERLRKLGITLRNNSITGETHRDRYVITGDSPLASNNLGKLAANALLEDVAKRT
ncbi:hypothetical protein V501_02805 [Pseudogymnoascus sp. VKM F-4519 (FW-2642)]|nr:hypothetical protein V501_02805 [Pseudogymnoascus sp. VKM F-4519 (FW-2642)]